MKKHDYGTAKPETVHLAGPVCGLPLEDVQAEALGEVICKQAAEGKLTLRTIMDAIEIVRDRFETDAVI